MFPVWLVGNDDAISRLSDERLTGGLSYHGCHGKRCPTAVQRRLRLRCNRFCNHNNHDPRLPSSCCTLHVCIYLRQLLLGNNQLKKLPYSVGFLTSLKTLQVRRTITYGKLVQYTTNINPRRISSSSNAVTFEDACERVVHIKIIRSVRLLHDSKIY